MIKQCQNCKVDFEVTSDDMGFYEKIKVPPPTFCPQCRLIRRMTMRNERSLYKGKCDFSSKEIFSAFSLEPPVKVYKKNWLSGQWHSWDSIRYFGIKLMPFSLTNLNGIYNNKLEDLEELKKSVLKKVFNGEL